MASSPPVVNQVEMHPWLTQDAVLAYNSSRGIVSQAWSPLARGQVLDNDELADIGAKYAKSVSQTVLRWHLQRGYGVVPKSVREERVLENIDVFDFALSTDEMNFISSLNRNFRTGLTLTIETSYHSSAIWAPQISTHHSKLAAFSRIGINGLPGPSPAVSGLAYCGDSERNHREHMDCDA